MLRLRLAAALAAAFTFSSIAQAQDGAMTAGTHHVQLVQVTMSNFAYAPNRLDLVAGSPVVLKFVNTSTKGHDFDAPELFASGTIAPEDRAKVADGSVEVEGGATVELRFTPGKAGTYPFHCSHFLHSSFGMTGEAVVE